MNTCKTCKHWFPTPDDDFEGLRGAGECQAIPQVWDVTDSKEGEPPNDWRDYRVLKPEHAGVLAMVEDGSQYRARLVSMPDFGCVQHSEGKP